MSTLDIFLPQLISALISTQADETRSAGGVYTVHFSGIIISDDNKINENNDDETKEDFVIVLIDDEDDDHDDDNEICIYFIFI